jgi:hypothetical protein
MAESEKIRGIRITSMFEELRQRKTLLKLILVDTDFEHLAVVTGLRRKESGSHFIIDTPRGFKEAAADIDIWQIRFEFIGKDNINYVFTTIGGQIAGNQIYIKLPEEMERKQRRKLFRINCGTGPNRHPRPAQTALPRYPPPKRCRIDFSGRDFPAIHKNQNGTDKKTQKEPGNNAVRDSP